MHRIVGFAAQLCQGRKVSVIAQAGEQFQRFLGLRSKTAQPADHQVHRIVAEPLVDDSVQIPCPRPQERIELEQPFFGEAREELSDEKGIAATASPVHQLSERPHLVGRTPQRVAQQLVDVVDRERAEDDLIDFRAGFAQILQLEHQGMCRVDLVVAICADEQQVTRVRMEEKIFDERQRGRIEPLQVIDENDERVFRPRKHADEPLEHGLKPQFGIDGREDRYGRLWADQSSEVGNEVGQQAALIADSFLDRVSPAGDVVRVAVQQLLNQPLKRLSQCRVGGVAEAQVEFS